MTDEASSASDGKPRTDADAQKKTTQGFNPLEQLFGLMSLVDPVEFAGKAIDASRRSTEALLAVLENFAGTLENLNRTTARVNALLDDIEEPLRRVMPQVGAAMNAMATMGEVASQMGEITKRLGPLTTLAENAGGLFGLRPNRNQGSSSQTE